MIARRTVLTIANMVVGSILGLVALKLASLYFDPVDIGYVGYAAGVLGLLSFMMDLGMGAAHVKRVSEGRNPGDCFATYAVYKLVVTLVYVATIFALLGIYVLVLRKPLVSTTMPVILITLGYFVARSFSDLATSSFEARLETAKTQLTQFSETLVRVAITIFGALVLGGVVLATSGGAVVAWIRAHPSETYAIAATAGGVAAMGVSLFMLRRAFERGRFRWDLLRDYATFALPLFLAGAVSMIALNIDSAVLGYFRSAEEVGVFQQVRRLPVMLAGFSGAINALLFPAISAMIARGDADGVHDAANRAIRYLSLVLVPLCAFVIGFAAPLTLIGLSAEYLPGVLALQLLTVYVVVQALGNVHALLLMGSNKPAVAANVAIAASVAVIIGDLLLVPDDIRTLGVRLAGLGIAGAAIATLASSLIWYGGLRAATRRHVGFRETSALWKHVLAAAIMLGVLLALNATALPFARWFHFLLYVPLGAAVYATALIALRELTRDDLRFVQDALHPGEMFRYVRSEIFHRKK